MRTRKEHGRRALISETLFHLLSFPPICPRPPRTFPQIFACRKLVLKNALTFFYSRKESGAIVSAQILCDLLCDFNPTVQSKGAASSLPRLSSSIRDPPSLPHMGYNVLASLGQVPCYDLGAQGGWEWVLRFTNRCAALPGTGGAKFHEHVFSKESYRRTNGRLSIGL